jgi:hypothetical protein
MSRPDKAQKGAVMELRQGTLFRRPTSDLAGKRFDGRFRSRYGGKTLRSPLQALLERIPAERGDIVEPAAGAAGNVFADLTEIDRNGMLTIGGRHDGTFVAQGNLLAGPSRKTAVRHRGLTIHAPP